MIWAQDKNRGIGIDNKLPWSLPDDFAFFKRSTLNSAIVMGKKTYESLGKKPLKNRLNIVLSSDSNYDVENTDVYLVKYPQDAVDLAESFDKKLYVIGGGSVYQSFMDLADVLLVTDVNTSIKADTFAPEIPLDNFYLANDIKHDADDKHEFEFEFKTYQRKLGV
jgi:dihydrofolate reductase